MNRVNEALSRFKEGFTCSQSVFGAFAESFGLDRKIALRISQAFGGGMARMGETCGAVTGAFFVIGLKHGRDEGEDVQAKEKTYEIVREFVRKFVSLYGSILCRELLGYDLSLPEGLKLAKEQNLFETLCPRFVQDAVHILEEIL